MRYLFLILLFISCNDTPKNNNGGTVNNGGDVIKPPPIDIVIPVDTIADYRLDWPDRRPIGMVMLASYEEPYESGKNNWKLGGERQFSEAALMAHADECIKNMKALNAQGMVTWDLNGQNYPHAISYIGDPRTLPLEIDTLADKYFEKFTNAGFRTGVCLRPDSMVYKDGWAYHYTVENVFQNLYDKILYARSRWGCSLFYVDSNVGGGLDKKIDSTTGKYIQQDNTAGYGGLLPAGIFRALSERFPDCLIMPEHQNNEYYLYTAPYNDKNFRSYLLPEEKGFQVLAVGDDFTQDELNKSVKQGNVLMARVWYPSPEINKIKIAYDVK